MSPEDRMRPVVRSAGRSGSPDGIPEIHTIHYAGGELRIRLEFAEPDRVRHVVFETTRGFRVLDEGDLSEFWDPARRAEGWLWEVDSGGWLDLERHRPTFVTNLDTGCREFLVLGQNDCVSVIAPSEPDITSER